MIAEALQHIRKNAILTALIAFGLFGNLLALIGASNISSLAVVFSGPKLNCWIFSIYYGFAFTFTFLAIVLGLAHDHCLSLSAFMNVVVPLAIYDFATSVDLANNLNTDVKSGANLRAAGSFFTMVSALLAIPILLRKAGRLGKQPNGSDGDFSTFNEPTGWPNVAKSPKLDSANRYDEEMAHIAELRASYLDSSVASHRQSDPIQGSEPSYALPDKPKHSSLFSSLRPNSQRITSRIMSFASGDKQKAVSPSDISMKSRSHSVSFADKVDEVSASILDSEASPNDIPESPLEKVQFKATALFSCKHQSHFVYVRFVQN